LEQAIIKLIPRAKRNGVLKELLFIGKFETGEIRNE